MNLIIDIGNTLIKMAVFDGQRLVCEKSTERLLGAMLDELSTTYGQIDSAIVCSTRGDVPEVVELVRPRVKRLVEFSPGVRVPIANAYLSPQTLGCDRLAAAVGAVALYPGRNVLIVDFGTAVTIDLVTADATYRGGCISPGVQTRFRALHDYTATLPLCRATDEEGLQGLTTRQAIELGVMNSVSFEIEGYISRMQEQIGDLCVIFTGGDANLFVKRIKNTIFANCNLVFCGLNRILEYNASEEPHS